MQGRRHKNAGVTLDPAKHTTLLQLRVLISSTSINCSSESAGQ